MVKRPTSRGKWDKTPQLVVPFFRARGVGKSRVGVDFKGADREYTEYSPQGDCINHKRLLRSLAGAGK